MSNITLLNKSDVVKIVRFSKSTIDRMIRAGKFPAPIRAGESPRWRSDEIQAWILEQTKAAYPSIVAAI